MLTTLPLQATIPLSEINPAATLEVYARPDGTKKPAMLVLPGGGMQTLAPTEAEPICRYYDAHGYQTFVLNYSVGDFAKYPAILHECSRAVWEVRKNAEAYGVDPDRIVMNGFSAGAHVLTMFAVYYHLPISREGTDVPEGGNAFCATVTGYTPTTFAQMYARMATMPPEQRAKMEEAIKNRTAGGYCLLDAPGTFFGEIECLTTHDAVNEHTPPAFLWQTIKDAPVSAWEYAMALKKFGTEFELHYFSDDYRCQSMNFDPDLHETTAPAAYNTTLWPEMSLHWLDRVFARLGQ